jgi:hypothetical protein
LQRLSTTLPVTSLASIRLASLRAQRPLDTFPS